MLAPASAAQKLDIPDGAQPVRISWLNAGAVIFYHAVAALAVVPWLFSWTGAVLALLGLYVFGTLGINLCYHRLLTHRGLVCPKWLERSLVVLGVCCFQDTPARWVAVHRRHHQQADEQPDPHSPLVSFWWAHIEWVYVDNRELNRLGIYERYAKDILRDRFYVALERGALWLWIIVASWVVFFAAGFLAVLLTGGSSAQALQFGLSVLVWGVFLRTVLVWHITWSVNSAAHLWGYRNYATEDCSRNNVFVGLISNGEGWHNNHHADPRSARHGHKPGEIDVTWYTVKLLEMLGLASKVAAPSPYVLSQMGKEATDKPIPKLD